MRFRRLGRSGLKLAPIGLGTDNFANPVDEVTAHALLDRATAAGINLVDTANSYGGQRYAGESERFIGRWLQRNGQNRAREWFDLVILTHCVRHVSKLAYVEQITAELPANEFFADEVRRKLLYYPTVTRDLFRNQGRLSDLIASGKLFTDLDLPAPTLADDRFMICGSPAMLRDLCTILDARGFRESRHGESAHYVIERAFVEK